MKLEFLFAPTADLDASLKLYRDGLGCQEEHERRERLAEPDRAPVAGS